MFDFITYDLGEFVFVKNADVYCSCLALHLIVSCQFVFFCMCLTRVLNASYQTKTSVWHFEIMKSNSL